MGQLPDKLSDLIEVALADLEKVEAMPETYRVRMAEWHYPDYKNKSLCFVCLAGSVMAMTLGADPKSYLTPRKLDVDDHDFQRLLAIDYIRKGHIQEALSRLNITIPENFDLRGWPVISYDYSPTFFKRDMKTIVSQLRAIGL